jgi:hypothetical protein
MTSVQMFISGEESYTGICYFGSCLALMSTHAYQPTSHETHLGENLPILGYVVMI